jgi:hypothetical protein
MLYFRWAAIGLLSGPIIMMHYYSDGAPAIFLFFILAAGPALGLCYAIFWGTIHVLSRGTPFERFIGWIGIGLFFAPVISLFVFRTISFL